MRGSFRSSSARLSAWASIAGLSALLAAAALLPFSATPAGATPVSPIGSYTMYWDVSGLTQSAPIVLTAGHWNEDSGLAKGTWSEVGTEVTMKGKIVVGGYAETFKIVQMGKNLGSASKPGTFKCPSLLGTTTGTWWAIRTP